MTDGTVEEDASLNISITTEGFKPKLEETEDTDPELADWFQVDTKPAVSEDSETEDESDADSNNDDVKGEDDDEWFQVPHSPAVKPLDENVRDFMVWHNHHSLVIPTVEHHISFTVTGKGFFIHASSCYNDIRTWQWGKTTKQGNTMQQKYSGICRSRVFQVIGSHCRW